MTTSTQNSSNTEDLQSEDVAELWRSFLSPQNSVVFYQCWLALLCRQLPGATSGALLLPSEAADALQPVAIWPNLPRDLSFYGQAVQQALAEMRAAIKKTDGQTNAGHLIAYPIQISKQILGVVVVETNANSEAEIQTILKQIHWSSGWLHKNVQSNNKITLDRKLEQLGSITEILTTAISPKKLQEILLDLSNQIVRHLKCSRVAIGLTQSGSVRIAALSNTAWFEKNTSVSKLYANAMNEAFDRLSPIEHRTSSREKSQNSTPAIAHEALALETKSISIYSLPLILGAECIGIITLERSSLEPFSEAELGWVHALVNILPGAIQHKRLAERNIFLHIKDNLKELNHRLFGPRYFVFKFTILMIFLVFFCLAIPKINYKVSAKSVIEGEIQRAIVAPFDGFISESHARAGDFVTQGQILCRLDDRDLKLEQQKWAAELEQRNRTLRQAMAKNESAEVQVINAQIAQAEAQLALTSEKISRTEISAPFDGIVISGDLSQLISSPVELGKELFKLAPLHSYRVILQIDERDIRNIEVKQSGKMLISGISNSSLDFKISKITPVASAENGANFFKVEAELAEAPPQLRPGMEGVAKVSIGERRPWWILTHTFTDWLTLQLWNWLP